MSKIQDRADRFVRKIFRPNGTSNEPQRPEQITTLAEKMRRKREQALKLRRGL